MSKPQVFILMGSDSDYDVMKSTTSVLDQFEVPYEIMVASAHRSPELVRELAASAESKGVRVFIAAAGGAAHLAGVVAAHTTLPVIGVPINATSLGGFDALLATVQMPPGIPVATVAVGKFGAHNAAILAVQMMALSDEKYQKKLQQHKLDLTESVQKKNKKLQTALSGK